jgi:hypothetical protein
VVLDGDNAWFMDNGAHRYRLAHGRRRRRTHGRTGWSASRCDDANDTRRWRSAAWRAAASPTRRWSTPRRQIVVAYDSANRCLQAWRFDAAARHAGTAVAPAGFGCASHMLLYPDTGELVINDYRRFGEEVVCSTSRPAANSARVRPGGLTQGVVFPSAGWGRDLYWSSMGRLTRLFVD